MHTGEKIRAIREAESLTREQFGALIDVPIGTLRRYETGRIDNIGGEVLIKIVSNERFYKYMSWLMTGKTNEETGQISPSLSHDGLESISTPQKNQGAG